MIRKIFGDGKQTRSFLYIDECREGIQRLMNSGFSRLVNIGSKEIISINNLTLLVMQIAQKKLRIRNISGLLNVRGSNSDNKPIFDKPTWKPSHPLRIGMEKNYHWISEQINTGKKDS